MLLSLLNYDLLRRIFSFFEEVNETQSSGIENNETFFWWLYISCSNNMNAIILGVHKGFLCPNAAESGLWSQSTV